MIYLASPYSHENPTIREQRFLQVREFAARMIRKGLHVFCPIAYAHQFAVEFPDVGTRWGYWKDFDLAMIHNCDQLWVLRLPGWQESVGVQAEVREACRLPHLQIRYVDFNMEL